ncbi:hypothetical protein WJX73_002552 [Symbiochloris irregularis]|uniref:Uncharacterized protein n=1 Tax=Symbiochloris irregularis TaxID=706552 RepID=A0AAW1PAT8_9CHLO
MQPQSADDRQAKKDECVRQALIAGGKGAAWGLAGGALSIGTLQQFSPGFRRSLGISGKTALVVSPAFLLYFLLSELALNECARKQRLENSAARFGAAEDILPKRTA